MRLLQIFHILLGGIYLLLHAVVGYVIHGGGRFLQHVIQSLAVVPAGQLHAGDEQFFSAGLKISAHKIQSAGFIFNHIDHLSGVYGHQLVGVGGVYALSVASERNTAVAVHIRGNLVALHGHISKCRCGKAQHYRRKQNRDISFHSLFLLALSEV